MTKAREAQGGVAAGHQVVLHARSKQRAQAAAAAVPGAAATVVGDLASLAQTRTVAEAAAAHGRFDAVVHNAGVMLSDRHRPVTEDGLELTFQVNVLAPYLLTTLMPLPGRLIYLTSGMSSGGTIDLTDLQRERRRWDGTAHAAAAGANPGRQHRYPGWTAGGVRTAHQVVASPPRCAARRLRRVDSVLDSWSAAGGSWSAAGGGDAKGHG